MSQTPAKDSPEPETADVLPSTTSQRTYLADDVTNEPTVRVQQAGPVTTYADHVPDDAPTMLTTKVVAPQQAKTAPVTTAGAETA